MDNKIQEIIKIELGENKRLLSCYILENGKHYIDYRINSQFRVSAIAKTPQTTLIDKQGNEIKAYSINQVVDNLSPKVIKEYAQSYIQDIIERGGIIEEEKKLSDFDRLMKRALDYNPKDKE